MNRNLPKRIRAWADDAALGYPMIGAYLDLKEAAAEVAARTHKPKRECYQLALTLKA